MKDRNHIETVSLGPGLFVPALSFNAVGVICWQHLWVE